MLHAIILLQVGGASCHYAPEVEGSLRLFGNRCTSDERHQALKQLDGKKEEHPVEFARLAHSFEKLEKTSSRLALIAILAELFRLIESPDEIAKVCYLVQGRVAPFFEALEIGME